MQIRNFMAIAMIMASASLHGAPTEPQLSKRPRYILRPGDTLQLQYRLTPEFNQTAVVQPDGYVSVSIAGNLQVAGLNVEQAHDLILAKESQVLKDPELNLTLEEFTRPYVVVAGEVAKPGQIEIRDQMTAISAILLAGGFTNSAKSGQVIVFRKVNDSIAEVRQLNLTRVGKTPQLEHDMALQPGDMILVPHDRISRLQHYIQALNIGMYMNPTDFIK
jgi:polysaccharide biosynthesis/export protein